MRRAIGEEPMRIPKDAVLLRIFLSEKDRFEHRPLNEAIVLKARERCLGGATVLRGSMGFGRSNRLHRAKTLRLSYDLPIVIEIVDTEAKIMDFLPILERMMTAGLVTLGKLQVQQYDQRACGTDPAGSKERLECAG
jgi:PII-like signaling protein